MAKNIVCCGLSMDFWDEAKELLARPLSRNMGYMDIDDVKDRVNSNRMQLWGVHDGSLLAAIITEVVHYPSKKVFRLVLVGGDGMDEWMHKVAETLHDYARYIGAQAVEIQGRRGWVRALEKYGYKEYHTTVMKELKE